jgi:hypothetical protein
MTIVNKYCSNGSTHHDFAASYDENRDVTLICSRCKEKTFLKIGYQFKETKEK